MRKGWAVARLLVVKIQRYTTVNRFSTTASQTNDNKTYSHLCAEWPVEIKQTEHNAKGRGLFLTRKILPNFLICEEEPFVSCPSLYMKPNEYCSHCYRHLAPIKNKSSCRHCQEVYCSKICEERSWRFSHEVLCKSKHSPSQEMTPFGEQLKGLEKYCREQGRRYPILAAHVLARTLLDSKKGDHKLDDGLSSDEVLRTLSFATHEEPEWKQDYEKFSKVFFGGSAPPETFSYEWYKRTMQIFHINALSITPEISPLQATPTAHFDPVGLYPLLSLANHSCDPSARVLFLDSAHARLVAARRLEFGEEASIAYVNPGLPYKERQRHLRTHYGFECKCVKCEKEKEESG